MVRDCSGVSPFHPTIAYIADESIKRPIASPQGAPSNSQSGDACFAFSPSVAWAACPFKFCGWPPSSMPACVVTSRAPNNKSRQFLSLEHPFGVTYRLTYFIASGWSLRLRIDRLGWRDLLTKPTRFIGRADLPSGLVEQTCLATSPTRVASQADLLDSPANLTWRCLADSSGSLPSPFLTT